MISKHYVLNKILETQASDEPWRHLVIKDFIPQSLFSGIKEETSKYLDDEKLKEIHKEPKGPKGRRAFANLFNKSVDFKPNKKKNPNLHEYFKILNDKEVERAIKKKVNLPNHHEETLSVDMWSAFDIHISGFVYGVHADHGAKVHTLVHYFGDDGDDEELGTSLYSPNKKNTKLNTLKDALKRPPYIPNTALLFSPCYEKGFITNHSMYHLSEKTRYRKTIQTFWLGEKQNWLKKLKTATRLN
tara:strand:- start:709 stop:1440 length:732 start_codon:yes stop_codon:yes gene_type:complete